MDELLSEVQIERAVERSRGDRRGGLAEQQGLPPGSTK
ncbi:hypothetical protein SLI_6981 [Streptomyces lividans 1326]|uniref:Uncharacterized protein n=1 Tax=Streptomyces lividans 1326 TaxID=1200984 RepID=A0A7U9HGC7_STRLI|nr:hypothetical protein SLI_6981 [Streptomyces lividans 1326]